MYKNVTGCYYKYCYFYVCPCVVHMHLCMYVHMWGPTCEVYV